MFTEWSKRWRLLALPVAASLFIAACGDEQGSPDVATTEATTQVEVEVEVEEQPSETPAENDSSATSAATEDVQDTLPDPEGTLRMVEFSPAATFNPAGAQTAQSAYLYPVYNTLTRQTNDLTLEPSLATGWTQPDVNVWEFTLRDDVTFHDGAEFDAQVAVDNIKYHAAFEGNPNRATWALLTDVRVIDDLTFQVEFSAPAPQFPLEMSMVQGMMISPNFLDGTDLTRNPQGSGPWIWSEDESEAGVTEVYVLNENYWNPADQGVERVTVTAVSDNSARLNALLTGEADIMSTTRDGQVQTALDAGMEHISVPNFFPYIAIIDREGSMNPPLADVRVRQAILKAIDLEAYNDAIHAGLGDARSGVFPTAFAKFHVPELSVDTFDPEGARQLLEEAGYGDGVTITMPVMPSITPQMDLIIQMLGAVGITVEGDPINNGELGAHFRAGKSPLTWNRNLLVHPAVDLAQVTAPDAPLNPFGLDDVAPLHAVLQEAVAATDPEVARAKYAEVTQGLIELGVIVPLGHGNWNAMFAPYVTGVTLGLNMQAPMPYGVRING